MAQKMTMMMKMMTKTRYRDKDIAVRIHKKATVVTTKAVTLLNGQKKTEEMQVATATVLTMTKTTS